MAGHRGVTLNGVRRRVPSAKLRSLIKAKPRWDVAKRIVSARLIGHKVRHHTARGDRLIDIGCVADDANRSGLARRTIAFHPQQRVIEIGRDLVEIAGVQTLLRARAIDLYAEVRGPREHRGERLSATHSAEATRKHQTPAQRATKMLTPRLSKCLVGSLNDPLGADVDPASCGHLTVHHQPATLQIPEVLPIGPLSYEIGVCDKHPRSIGVRAGDAHRLPRLYQQSFIIAEVAQRRDDPVKARPVSGSLARATVHDQIFWTLGNLGVEVVVKHPQSGLLHPTAAGELTSAWGTEYTRHSSTYSSAAGAARK